MNIYSINNEIEELIERLIDPETGEIDEDVADELDELEMSICRMMNGMATMIAGRTRNRSARLLRVSVSSSKKY